GVIHLVGTRVCREHDGGLRSVGSCRAVGRQERSGVMIGIAIGGFSGAITRYFFYLLIESKMWQPKTATWLVNSIGSFTLGLFIGSGNLSSFWITGFLGAFTTFSTMALDIVKD